MQKIHNIKKEMLVYCSALFLVVFIFIFNIYAFGLNAKANQKQVKYLMDLKTSILEIENEFTNITASKKYFVSVISSQQNILDQSIVNLLETNLETIDKKRIKSIVAEKTVLYSKINRFFKLDANSQEAKKILLNIFDETKNIKSSFNSLEKRIISKENHWKNLVLSYVLIISTLILTGLIYFRFKEDYVFKETVLREKQKRQKIQLEAFYEDMVKLKKGIINEQNVALEGTIGEVAEEFYRAKKNIRTALSVILETVTQAAKASRKTQLLGSEQVKILGKQSREIVSTTASLNTVAASIQKVLKETKDSKEISQRFSDASGKSLADVNKAITDINIVKDNVEETANRIKRLAESAQEIGDSVSLIEDLAEQTNILSLNASIQAASAGEAGRGFSVVADEIQRLSERASMATKEVEVLVRTIQTETKQAVVSLEQSLKQVLGGVKSTQQAESALNNLDAISTQLSDFIEDISKNTDQQTVVSNQVAKSMGEIQQMSTDSLTGMESTISAIKLVGELVEELLKIASQFSFTDVLNEKKQ